MDTTACTSCGVPARLHGIARQAHPRVRMHEMGRPTTDLPDQVPAVRAVPGGLGLLLIAEGATGRASMAHRAPNRDREHPAPILPLVQRLVRCA